MSCFKINLIQENFINYLVVVKCTDHYKHSTTIFHLRENPSFHSSLRAFFASYFKLGAIPGNISLSSKEKINEFTDDSSIVTENFHSSRNKCFHSLMK